MKVFFDRTRLQEEYCKQAESVFQQWENDIDKIKEQEEKLTVIAFFFASIFVMLASLLFPEII